MTAIEKKFYNIFWTDLTCRAIFSAHKTQLLESEVELIVAKEKFYAQRLVLTNSEQRKIGKRLVQRTESASIELVHNLQAAAKRYFNEARFEDYISKRFGEGLKKIEADIRKPGKWLKVAAKLLKSIDKEKDIFTLLAQYKFIPEDVITSEQFTKYAESEMNTQLREFLKKENLSDLAISIDLISTYYDHKIKHNLIQATKHYTDVFYTSESYNNRLELFDRLYEIGAINGGKLKSYYECVNCPTGTLNGVLTIDITPSRLKMKCPGCGKELLYIVPYEIEKTIYEQIVHKDGLLFFAIQNLFEQYGYDYQANKMFPPDVEIDFCLLNEDQLCYELVEIKVYKTDRPHDTQVGNIRDAVAQVKKAVDKLAIINPNFKSIQKSLITNLSADQVYKAARKELDKELKEYNINIFSIDEYYLKVKR